MSLRSFIDEFGAPTHTIAVVSDGEPGPLAEMLAETFETQSIGVQSASRLTAVPEPLDLETEGDVAVLLEDGDPIAASPMRDLYDSLLAINSDLFVTGARSLGEIELPDVLANLAESRLRLRGYPLAHKEKLLLILVSRYIEQQAWVGGDGTVRAAFQRLSRMDDENGTREVYDRLAASDLDVHVYGVDDGTTVDLEVTTHTGTEPVYRNGWFVVYRPGETTADSRAVALVCLETESRTWDGVWTRDPDRVAAVDEFIASEL